MALSDFALRSAKPRERPYKLADGAGLYLHVQTNGKRFWRMKYRFAGKEKLLSFGEYPLVSIADARRKRDDARRQLIEGNDPSAVKRLQQLEAEDAARQTFELIADEYLERLKKRNAAASTIAKTTWLLKDLAKPLANRPVKEIHPAEILRLLQRIEKSGRRETARRLRGTLSSVFKHAIVTLRADSDPTIPLHGALLPPAVVGRAAIVDEKEFGKLVRTIAEYDGWPTIRAALLFLIYTCVRPGEVRGARREEFDMANAVWHIPAERMKMRQPHDVPLSTQAMAVLKEVWSLSEDGALVFPSIRSIQRPLSDGAFNSALRRMGYEKNQVTAHGFRVSASSILNSHGYDPDVIEAILAHQDKNSIRRTYNRASYWNQRISLMQEWSDLVNSF